MVLVLEKSPGSSDEEIGRHTVSFAEREGNSTSMDSMDEEDVAESWMADENKSASISWSVLLSENVAGRICSGAAVLC